MLFFFKKIILYVASVCWEFDTRAGWILTIFTSLSLSLPLSLIGAAFTSMSLGLFYWNSSYTTGKKMRLPLFPYPLTTHHPLGRSSPFPTDGNILRSLGLHRSSVGSREQLPCHLQKPLLHNTPPPTTGSYIFWPLFLSGSWALEGGNINIPFMT